MYYIQFSPKNIPKNQLAKEVALCVPLKVFYTSLME